IRVGDGERDRWFVGRRTAPYVDDEPYVRDLDVPRRAPAQNATLEDRFVKSNRSFNVRDGEKVCDGKPILRRHLIVVLFEYYLVHGRLRFGKHFYVRQNARVDKLRPSLELKRKACRLRRKIAGAQVGLTILPACSASRSEAWRPGRTKRDSGR